MYLQGNGLVQYARMAGELLAKGHARSGDPCALSGYLGTADKFDTAMARFGITYANQTVKDWEALRRAIRHGKIKAEANRTRRAEEIRKEKVTPAERKLAALRSHWGAALATP